MMDRFKKPPLFKTRHQMEHHVHEKYRFIFHKNMQLKRNYFGSQSQSLTEKDLNTAMFIDKPDIDKLLGRIRSEEKFTERVF